MKIVNQQADRARKIVQNLLAFARRRKPERRSVHIHEIVDRIVELKAYELTVSNIQIIKKYDPHIPFQSADEHQLEQAFLNILINAEQAMLDSHGQGTLEITTLWEAKQNTTCVSFRDDGPGIAPENLSKIFDPFYTTKSDGKGTGLGMSISYGIIKEHGGRIHVVNNKNCGVTFTVELPITEIRPSEIITASCEMKHEGNVGKKNVLVVDDEASVSDLVKTILERDGHNVETAQNGVLALELIERNHYDAVITDFKMPEKGGADIYLHCQEKNPCLAKKILILSGDVAETDTIRFVENHQVPFIEKPFDVETMLSSFHQLFYTN